MTTAACNELADYKWLTGPEAEKLLTEMAADSSPLHTRLAALRKHVSPARAHLVVEQVELRCRAADKFTAADRMFFTRIALEQATSEAIANYKATRIASSLLAGMSSSNALAVADLCCGIGGDLISLIACCSTIRAVDANPIAAHLASENVRAVLNRDIEIPRTDAVHFNLREVAAWHIDPDRRPAGKRTTSLDHSSPDGAALVKMLAQNANAAMKLAPATDTPREWSAACEREWISHNRECRQQIAWHGALATSLGQHRATILSSPPRISEERTGEGIRTLTGHPNQPIPITHHPARYIYDTDSAIRAAHLTGALAAEHNLQALSAGPTYLTADTPITIDPALACFEVTEVLPFRTRTLAKLLRERTVGQLEIKTRGVKLDPEKLRHELKLQGDNPATLLITTIAARPTAILAQRM